MCYLDARGPTVLESRRLPVPLSTATVNLLTIDALLGPGRRAEGEVRKLSPAGDSGGNPIMMHNEEQALLAGQHTHRLISLSLNFGAWAEKTFHFRFHWE